MEKGKREGRNGEGGGEGGKKTIKNAQYILPLLSSAAYADRSFNEGTFK